MTCHEVRTPDQAPRINSQSPQAPPSCAVTVYRGTTNGVTTLLRAMISSSGLIMLKFHAMLMPAVTHQPSTAANVGAHAAARSRRLWPWYSCTCRARDPMLMLVLR